jgi:hypothetical protein
VKNAEMNTSVQGEETYKIMTNIYQKLMDKPYVATGHKAQQEPEDKSLFDQILDNITLPEDAQNEEGPHEGDTKPGKDGMLILKDGHWVKMGVDDLPVPEFTGGNAVKFTAAAAKLKEIFATEGKGALKSDKAYFTWHKNGTVTVGVNGTTFKNMNPNTATADFANFAKYVFGLKALVSKQKVAKKVAAKKGPVTGYTQGLPAVDEWKQVGKQQGSNPGGKFQDAEGNDWYVKFPENEDHAKSEVLAARLYGAMGISGQSARLITRNGKIGIATKWVDNIKKGTPAELQATLGVLDNFAADAWLGNWDVVGTGFDNLQIAPDGTAMRVDAGGSLMYRAQGAKKKADEWSSSVTDIDTMRDPSQNPYAAKVFGVMTDADIAASVSKVAALSKAAIHQIVEANAPGDAKSRRELAELLIARRDDLIKRFPQADAKPTEKATFKTENITPPPDFSKWEGKGGEGLSSHGSINRANTQVVNEIYQAALKGDLEKINNAQATVFDKETKAPTGKIPASSHPSQHVKAYWKNLVNEVDLQLNPPEAHTIGQVVAGSDLGEIMDMLGETEAGDAVKHTPQFLKIGNYIVKGKIGEVAPFVPEVDNTVANSLNWKEAAKAHYAKVSHKAKETFSCYVTSSGAAMLNTALREGDLDKIISGQTVRQHLLNTKELLVDIPEGTSFVRNMGNSGYGATPDSKALKELEQFLISAEPGTVVQEPGFSSTSYVGGGHSGILGSNNIRWEFTAAKGVKAFPAWLTANKGEGEALLPPNAQYSIVSAKKQGKTVVVKAILLPTKD